MSEPKYKPVTSGFPGDGNTVLVPADEADDSQPQLDLEPDPEEDEDE